MSYLRFIADNFRLLTVGFLLAFSSSFGQTYFIALFSGHIRAGLGLSHGQFGGTYALATLASAMTLIWAGRKIDHVALELYVLAICGGLVLACLFTGWAPSVAVLGLGLYGLRLFGQGLMTHAGTTSMARYFDRNRGKAIAIASIGHPAGEAVFPLLAVLVMGLLGWRGTWVAAAAFLGLGLTPLVLWLLMHPGDRKARALAASPPDRHAAWAMQKKMLRQPRFFAYLFCTVAQPFIFTGVFFHQVHIVSRKGWELGWFAALFPLLAATALVVSLLAGALVDRFGGRRLLPFFLLPLGSGLVVLMLSSAPQAAIAFMLLTGMSLGAANVIVSSMWAEVYGTENLGAVRSLATSVMVFSTALSPVLFGWLLDLGFPVSALLMICIVYVAAASLSVALVPPPDRR